MSEKKHDDRTEEFTPIEADTFPDTELEQDEASALDKIKKLRQKLQNCEEEKRTQLEDIQRTKADFLNAKKRLEEQLSRDKARISTSFISSLLPLSDSFEMAMNDPSWHDCDQKWRTGVEAIYAQLKKVLEAHQVTAIDETGVSFDPYQHEAISHEGEGDAVVRIIQKGYKVGDEIIRPARVVVGSDA